MTPAVFMIFFLRENFTTVEKIFVFLIAETNKENVKQILQLTFAKIKRQEISTFQDLKFHVIRYLIFKQSFALMSVSFKDLPLS